MSSKVNKTIESKDFSTTCVDSLRQEVLVNLAKICCTKSRGREKEDKREEVRGASVAEREHLVARDIRVLLLQERSWLLKEGLGCY